MKIDKRMFAIAAAALMAVGCASDHGRDVTVDEQTDLAEQNRLLVRMAAAEGVYNAVASERAVYPKDFDSGTAELNELGMRRVQMLISASSRASGHVTVVKGDEDADLYGRRVLAVRQRLAALAATAGQSPLHAPAAATRSRQSSSFAKKPA